MKSLIYDEQQKASTYHLPRPMLFKTLSHLCCKELGGSRYSQILRHPLKITSTSVDDRPRPVLMIVLLLN